ncbi:hypothetical protein DPMN_181522 [Dreissena polymorpha]|uniref:Uncharacterized protein n=1 Tax=Dreissena polymorpha TaxID=45954 RepID=A0A9D4I3S9_DREPO|nr:hypothetical protein DPMN_181522 [Dreissena polymorpha]
MIRKPVSISKRKWFSYRVSVTPEISDHYITFCHTWNQMWASQPGVERLLRA